MTINDEKLMAYVDGELDPAERAEVEAAINADPALRGKMEAHRNLRARLSGTFDGALDEPVPERLLAAMAVPSPSDTNVVHLARRPNWSAREWGAMAASVAAGVLIGLSVMRGQTPMVAVTEYGLMARGALQQALDTQLAADEAGPVRIGLSFRAREGGYCRTFDLTHSDTAGLACRGDEGWKVTMTAVHDSGGEVRMAGAPTEILAAVEAMIEGDPLDVVGEARARESGWR